MKQRMVKAIPLVCMLLLLFTLQAEEPVSLPSPLLIRESATQFQLQGVCGTYLTRISENWLKLVPDANPAILEMFRDRDRLPRRQMEPWAGEFAGKYLTGAVQVYRLTRDEELRRILTRFVADLVKLQADDGYLGPWPANHRLTGQAPNVGAQGGGPTWDAWGHYHIMFGLMLWHQEMNDEAALRCAQRIGDLLCTRFLGKKKPRLVDTGSTEMNLAPIDSLCLLFQATREPRYLLLARQIADEFAATDAAGKLLAGNYLLAALDGKEFFQSPKPRWESLHPILGLVRLYYLTGDARYRQAFTHWWWSIVKLDRHNNGGFSSGEQAQGNPYHQGAIETCCTIAWLAMSVEMLQLTGDSIVADEMELSTLNSVVGMHSPSGRWCTYNTPMDGVRKASAHEIVFQAREGSPELNCCSVNSARGFGMISDWAVLQHRDGIALNWYGPGSITTKLPHGHRVKLSQESEYPVKPTVRLKVEPDVACDFTLKLRIPHWSAETKLSVNGMAVNGVTAGKYLSLQRHWKSGDVVEVQFDFSRHYWVGERECKDRVSIYRGPLLLTYDRRFNTMDPAQLGTLNARTLKFKEVAATTTRTPLLLVETTLADGKPLRLCDFGSAGDAGSPYRSWLPAEGVKPAAYSTSNPLRSSREFLATTR